MITIGKDILLSARYETRVENFARCSYSIRQKKTKQNKKTHGSIQIDAINACLAVRKKKIPMEEAVE